LEWRFAFVIVMAMRRFKWIEWNLQKIAVVAYWGTRMPTPEADTRSERRKALDEQLAAEPFLPIPDPTPGEQPRPLEAHLASIRTPVAAVGVIETAS
jgi:hypothetical protein